MTLYIYTVDSLLYLSFSDQEAFIELLKCIFGTGCLAMPKGFANVGWLVGLISTVIFGGIMAQSVQMLVGYSFEI